MKNSNLNGVGTVFRYTVAQHYKTTSIRVFLAILFILALSAFPIMMLTHDSSDEVDSTQIRTLYLRNETGFAIDAKDITGDARYAALTVTETDAPNSELAKMINETHDAAAAVITLDMTKGYTVQGYYGENSNVSDADLSTLNGILENALREAQLRTLGVTQQQTDMLHGKAFTTVMRAEEVQGGTSTAHTGTHAFVNLAYSYAVLLLVTLAMSYIFQLCMEEKVSKLVESLLVSVRPTALLVGKILAVTVILFAGIALIVLGLIISYMIAKGMGDTSFIPESIGKALDFDPSALTFTPVSVVLLIICILLAYLTGAFYSGIVGSCCSKTEDTQQASVAVVIFIMIGYFIANFVPMFESEGANLFAALFPVSSIFVAFPYYLCGKIGLAVFLLALAIQILTVFLLARLAGSVYRMMLLYRGNMPKLGQLIAMLRENRAEKRAAGKEGSHGNEA